MKVLYCAECHCKVAEIVEGSKIKTGMVALCSNCETRRKALELKEKTKGKAHSMMSLWVFLGKGSDES